MLGGAYPPLPNPPHARVGADTKKQAVSFFGHSGQRLERPVTAKAVMATVRWTVGKVVCVSAADAAERASSISSKKTHHPLGGVFSCAPRLRRSLLKYVGRGIPSPPKPSPCRGRARRHSGQRLERPVTATAVMATVRWRFLRLPAGLLRICAIVPLQQADPCGADSDDAEIQPRIQDVFHRRRVR